MSLRIASFNVENLDDKSDARNPPLSERVPILRAAVTRLSADILCLQEVHGQELPEHTGNRPSRALSALDAVLAGTPYAGFERVHTTTAGGQPYDERNLVILSRFPIRGHAQYRNDLMGDLAYRKVMARPEEPQAKPLGWRDPYSTPRSSSPA